ncbi:hypothetical protein GH714_005554 [Hevea brasiliensis]|uniref:Phorbol-ester/DAG-type domain-containing protein n=1 Tax=Hevea brasiliensis TaxID=3981 RepID=A0A6A6KXY4_HEVBR|nr:hypothetical protein GH714_005554 [Hevea brasiliensis]
MEIQHFLHEHTLKLYENSDFDDLDCSGCGNSLSGQTYGCLGCEFFLHKYCAKLPQEMQHFFHPCTLFLTIGFYMCNGCYSHHTGTLGYRCKKCDFDLDVDCARHPTMISEGDGDQIQHYSHRHPLKFLATMGDNEALCQICGKLCSETAYNCSQCNFYLHKSCMHMVMASLKGKRGDVALRIVESEAVLSLDDMLVSLDAVERKQLDDIEVAIQKEIGTNITSLESKSEDIYSFAYSEQAFESFQDYLIPRTLIPTFQDLHAKNEGICARSMLSPKAKSLIFYFLCGVIENMRATRIVDITDQKLGEWFACLKWVKYAGFKFQFISEHMKHLAHAHFVVQARKFVEDFPVKLQQKIEQISQEMDKLTAELRALEDQREFHQRHEKSTTISLKKQFCNVPLAIKWKPAADGLL